MSCIRFVYAVSVSQPRGITRLYYLTIEANQKALAENGRSEFDYDSCGNENDNINNTYTDDFELSYRSVIFAHHEH